VNSVLRITTTCASALPCTTVDVTAPIPVTPKHGKLSDIFATDGVAGLAGVLTSLEVRSIQIDDPNGALFATGSINGALRLTKPKISLVFHDALDHSDDGVKIEALFPNLTIDPTATPGVTFTVTDRNGVVYEVTIPDHLWQLFDPIGTRWEFADRTGGINGVTKASIKQFKQGGEPAGYKIKLIAKDVDLSAADLPAVNLLISIPPPGGFVVSTAQRNRTCHVGGHSLSCK